MNADGAHFLLITLHFVYTLANQKCATLATQPLVNTYLSFLTILSCCYTLSTNIVPHLLHSVYTLSTLLCYTFLLHFVYAFLLHSVYTLCYTLSTLLLIKNAPHLDQKATTAPRIPMWSPTMVLTRRHFA